MIETILRNSLDVAPLVHTVKVCDVQHKIEIELYTYNIYITVITLVGETTAVLSSKGSIVLSLTDQNRADQFWVNILINFN